jgi:hypothetical protein
MANQGISPFGEGVGIVSSLLERNQRLSAMRQQQDQYAALFPLKMQQEELQNQQTKASIVAQGFQNQTASIMLEDQAELAKAQSQWNQGNTSYEPTFRSPVIASFWNTWKSNSDFESNIRAQTSNFYSRAAKLEGEDSSVIMSLIKPGEPPSPEAWSTLADLEQERDARLAREKTQFEIEKQKATEERQLNVAALKLEAVSNRENDIIENRAAKSADQRKYALFRQQAMGIEHDQTLKPEEKVKRKNQLYRDIYHEDPFTGEKVDPGSSGDAGGKMKYDPVSKVFKDAAGNVINFNKGQAAKPAPVNSGATPAPKNATAKPSDSKRKAPLLEEDLVDKPGGPPPDDSGEWEPQAEDTSKTIEDKIKDFGRNLNKDNSKGPNFGSRVLRQLYGEELAKEFGIKPKRIGGSSLLWSPAQVVADDKDVWEKYYALPESKRREIAVRILKRLHSGERTPLPFGPHFERADQPGK